MFEISSFFYRGQIVDENLVKNIKKIINSKT